jgi:hypothetical protein
VPTTGCRIALQMTESALLTVGTIFAQKTAVRAIPLLPLLVLTLAWEKSSQIPLAAGPGTDSSAS